MGQFGYSKDKSEPIFSNMYPWNDSWLLRDVWWPRSPPQAVPMGRVKVLELTHLVLETKCAQCGFLNESQEIKTSASFSHSWFNWIKGYSTSGASVWLLTQTDLWREPKCSAREDLSPHTLPTRSPLPSPWLILLSEILLFQSMELFNKIVSISTTKRKRNGERGREDRCDHCSIIDTTCPFSELC